MSNQTHKCETMQGRLAKDKHCNLFLKNVKCKLDEILFIALGSGWCLTFFLFKLLIVIIYS
jgi:hypothetical protein